LVLGLAVRASILFHGKTLRDFAQRFENFCGALIACPKLLSKITKRSLGLFTLQVWCLLSGEDYIFGPEDHNSRNTIGAS
jgi:hypothetical protein